MQMIDRRLGLMFALFSVLLMVAFGRAAWIQGVQGGDLRAEARSQQVDTVVVPGTRGRVLDRTGRVLAVSEKAATVVATPYQIKDPEKVARRMAPILGIDESAVTDALADREAGFAYIQRKVKPGAAEKVLDLGIEGISTIPDSRRIYPQGELAAQVIGAVGIDDDGLTGLEQSQEETLRGADGEQEIVRDALGDPISFETKTPAAAGDDIRLTIDASIQAQAESVIAQTVETYSAQGAAAIVMNPRSGDILALANYPTFNPKDLESASEEALRDRASAFTYEPGSTFKAVTVAAALEERLVTPDTVFDLPPTIQVADREIGESHPRGPLSLPVSDILAQSSNVGAVKIGLEVGTERLDKWIRTFGFGSPTGVDLPGEEGGIVPALEDYSGSTIGNLPIGQGLAVTPLQMASFYSSIANGGKLRTPQLFEEIGSTVPEAGEHERVMSKRTAGRLRTMLKGVLADGGTASEVEVPGYELAGKTGTAQKVVDGTYSDSLYVASFVGFAPADDPELLAVVLVDEPVGVHTGGAVAAPAFGEIAAFALPYLGVAPQ